MYLGICLYLGYSGVLFSSFDYPEGTLSCLEVLLALIGGHGCYLGESKYHGWIIKKAQIYDRKRFIEDYAYIAGKEENICVSKVSAVLTDITVQSATGDFTLVDYSEKSVVVFGDTKAIKEQQAALGGRFNKYLIQNGQKSAGWVFLKSKEQELL